MSLSAVSFALANLLAGYLTALACRPPNADSEKGWGKDTIRPLTSPSFLRLVQALVFFVSVAHSFVVLGLDSGFISLAQSKYLNPNLFIWTPYTVSCLFALIFIGAPLRLAAFGALGPRFTFGLAAPNELNTSGIYSWIQHPSYIGLVLVIVTHQFLHLRWDGALALWISEATSGKLDGYGLTAFALQYAVTFSLLGVRIREEEAMLREVFGAKWVDWNKRTRRIIPGLF